MVFRTLNEDVSVWEGSHGDVDPSVVLILAWMEATTNVLQKYAESHRQLYPASDIVVVRSHMHFFWRSEVDKKKTLAPVADYILSRVYTRRLNPSRRGMIVHTFSNGGGLQLLILSELLESRLKDIDASLQGLQYLRIPIALIFDSLPGCLQRTGMRSTEIASSQVHIPERLSYFRPTISTSIAHHVHTKGIPKYFPTLRAYLCRPDVLPGCTLSTPRLYAYSDADEVVAHESVEEHLEGIRTVLNVRAERFTGSRHVSHAKKDPKRYWSAVEGLWNEALHEAKVSLGSKL